MIKLLTPARRLYSDEYNAVARLAFRNTQRELVFVVKRFYTPEWGEKWREHFSVDFINGVPGHELKCDNRRLVTNYLRVGLRSGRRLANIRFAQGFLSGRQNSRMEDDITASITVPPVVFAKSQSGVSKPVAQICQNCEQRLFQRPDDAIHPRLRQAD